MWHLLRSQLSLTTNLRCLKCYFSAERKITVSAPHPAELYIMSGKEEKENKEQLLLFHIKVPGPVRGDQHFSQGGNVAIWPKRSMMCAAIELLTV